MKTPIVTLEDLPYTLSMDATITSQHGIERVQSNCPLSPILYHGNDKTSAQVINKRYYCCQNICSLGLVLVFIQPFLEFSNFPC
jgi:hypothetical protein